MIDLKELKRLADGATKGEWFNGSWSGRCYENHAHGRDVCNYQYTKSHGEKEDCVVSVDDGKNHIELIGWDDYGTVLKLHNAKYIAAAQPSTVKLLCELLEECVDYIRDIEAHHCSACTENLKNREVLLQKIREKVKL